MGGYSILVMKSINLIFILFAFILQTTAWGQNFGGLGYEWYYSGHNAAPPEYSGYVRFSHAGDTAIANRQANLLLQEHYNYTGVLIRTSQLIVTQASDTVFLYREDLDAFIVLYIFNANIGDTLTLDSPFSVPGVSISSIYRVVIDTIVVENHNGVDMKKYYTTPLDDFYWPGALIDQIGCTGWFFPSTFFSIPEGPGDIRCFSNPQVSINFNNYPCDYTLKTSTSDANNDLWIEIFPNPSSDKLYISSFQEIDAVRMLDKLGRTVIRTNQIIFDVQNLKSGSYVVQVTTKSGRVYTQKIIKI